MNKKIIAFILLLLLIGLLVLPYSVPYFYIFIATEILILGLFATSFNLVFGYTGMLSFGHAAFFGFGAYACAMLLQALSLPLIVCLIIATMLGAVLALVIGFFSVRLNEVYFAMLTLAFGMMVFAVAHQWRSVTNGSDGIAGFSTGSLGLGIDINLANPTNYYYVTLAVVLVALFVLYRITISSFGLILQAIRQNSERVSYCGLDVKRYRLAAFTVSGAFAGLAGGLMAPFLRIVSPDLVHWSMSAEPVLMSILGGVNYFLGPLFGAGLFVLLKTFITDYTQAWMLVLGIILAIMVMFFRSGILGTILDRFESK